MQYGKCQCVVWAEGRPCNVQHLLELSKPWFIDNVNWENFQLAVEMLFSGKNGNYVEET